MNITPITENTPHCYGVLCPVHAECARYHAVNGAIGSPHTVATCRDMTTGELPLFVQFEQR